MPTADQPTVHTAPPTESPMERAFQQGHRRRQRHELVVIMASVDGILWHRVYLCCGETVEQRVADGLATWASTAPPVSAIAHVGTREY